MKNNTVNAPNLSSGAKDIIPTLNQLESNELYWLSGYCTALAFKGNSTQAVNSGPLELVQPSKLKQQVTLATAILYASQTGNSKKIAESLYQSIIDSGLNQNGIKPELASLQDFSNKKLKGYQLILIVASTHGEGEPPDDAIDFHEFVNGKRAPKLEGVKHAILSLGDSSYEFFCQTGKDFDQALIKQGSQALVERVDCDLDYEEQAHAWINNVVEKLASLSGSEELITKTTNNSAQIESSFTKTNPLTAKILTNQKITGRGSVKSINHIEISLEDSGLTYQPGDSIGIWAKNNAKVVSEILELTGLTGNEDVEFKSEAKSLEIVLLENLELSLINKGFVETYAKLTKSKQVQRLLNKGYSDYIKNHQIVDIIKLSPIKLEAQQLVDLLKAIKPRMYSISSSLLANPDEVHITVALVESIAITEAENTVRYGTASHYLIETLDEDDEVFVFVEENRHFKLPEDNKPLIMIGPGTGVAPFRSFLQEREETEAQGKNWLFFGNPNFNTDFLYQTELLAFQKSGLLTNLTVAFSRDQKQKIYVQDKLLENASQIWQWLNDEQASIYLCGDMSRMAKDVHAALIQIISNQAHLSIDEAESYLKTLKKENRYQRDVY